MALRAFALHRTIGKLAVVRVLMAIHAFLKSQRLLEFAARVARDAGDFRVRAEQREFGLGVVECESRQDFLPAGGGVAFLAALFEATAVRIDMAVAAVGELHVLEPRRPARHVRLVAFLAGNLNVHAGQRITRFGVIELLRILPVIHVVAAGAILAKLALVNIFVTTDAVGGQSQVGLGGILTLEQREYVRTYVRGNVTLFAGNAGVLPFQGISGQAVIELFHWSLPVNQREVGSVMLEMAAHTILAVGIFHLQLRVISPLLREQLGDLLVAIQTFERGRAGAKFMAFGALRGSA